jgi:processive 1,2-diacylglycerol beta-glucosyltransferase
MSGSQGDKQVIKMAQVLLKNFDCGLIIIAGKNKLLKALLEEKLLPEYKDNVTIIGFTDKLEDYMKVSDILIIRASPNVLMESVNLCKPVIVTGSLTGQEKKNPEFVIKNNLGVVCEDIDELPKVVNDLFEGNRKILNGICYSQVKYRNVETAREISDFLVQVVKESRGKTIDVKSCEVSTEKYSEQS